MSGESTGDWFAADAATFGDRLAGAREAAGISQSDLARRLGVKLKTVTSWEQDISEPRANKLQMLAGLLNVSIRWLLTGEGDGLDAPVTDAEMAADTKAILTEMRQMRGEIGRMGERLGMLEKRLRAILKETL